MPPLMVVAHPSPDLYGSDRQLLVTLDSLTNGRWDIVVILPEDGPLVPLLEEHGARVVVRPFPVLRKSILTPAGFLRFGVEALTSTVSSLRLMREFGASAVLVNTLTVPTWLMAGRLSRLPVMCHVHEAEEDQSTVVRRLLAGQLLLADVVVVNSQAARRAILDVIPSLGARTSVVHNGVPEPEAPAGPLRHRTLKSPLRLALVARLSPRKGIDVALGAVAILRGEGRMVTLDICGTVYPGYEWYEEELRSRAAQPDLQGAVTFAGYVNPTGPVLADADVVLVPSRNEPFGNTAVEGLLAGRPVVASAVQGLQEVIRDQRTGVLVAPDDPPSLAQAIARLADDPAWAAALAEAGAADARARFSEVKYAESIRSAMDAAVNERWGAVFRRA